MSGTEITAAGIAVLIVNLASRHVDQLHSDVVIWITGWLGAILVIVGLGKIFFLEKD